MNRKGDAFSEDISPMWGYDAYAPFYSTEFDDIIVDGDEINARPNDVDTSKQLIGAFGAFEDEQAAGALIDLCKTGNAWRKFTYAEIDAFWQTHENNNRKTRFGFAGLLLKQYIAFDHEGFYYFTKSFVKKCLESNRRQSERAARNSGA